MNKGKLLVVYIMVFLLSSFAFAQDSAQIDIPPKITGMWFMEQLTHQQRVNAISEYIAEAKKEGIIIKRTPDFYILEIYREYDVSSEQKQYAVGALIKTLALLYGDWEEQGKAEEQVFKEYYGDQWKKMYDLALEVREKFKQGKEWR